MLLWKCEELRAIRGAVVLLAVAFFRFLHFGAMAGVMDGRPGTNNKSD